MKNLLRLDRLVQQIVETVHPLRILLFGSAARHELTPGSDLDLLLVMPDGTHRRKTAQAVYLNVRDAGVPFDVIVATPTDLARHKDNHGLIYRTILEQGQEVYAAA